MKKYRVVTILKGIVSSVILEMTDDDSIKYQRRLTALRKEGYLDNFQFDEVNNVGDIVVHLIISK